MSYKANILNTFYTFFYWEVFIFTERLQSGYKQFLSAPYFVFSFSKCLHFTFNKSKTTTMVPCHYFKPRIHAEFTCLSIRALSLFQHPLKDTRLHLVAMTPSCPVGYDNVSDFAFYS